MSTTATPPVPAVPRSKVANTYLEAQPSVLRDGSSLDLEYAAAGIAAVAALTGRRDIAARLWGVVERLDDDAERRMDRDDRARFERVLAPAERQAGRALDDEAAVELLRAVSGELDAAAG
jgi:hypothetical protein